MKKTLTTIILSFSILFMSSLWANKDLKENNFLLKKNNLYKSHSMNSSNRLVASDGAFGEGKLALTLGYGFSGGFMKVLLQTYEDEAAYSFSSFGPVHFRGEYGLSDKVGFALSVNHNSWKATWSHADTAAVGGLYYDEFKRSVTSILARINIHFGVTERLDPYWGIGAGYRMVNYTFTSTDPGYDTSIKSPFVVGFETTVGLRYYLMEGFGLYAELGLSQSIIQGGLAVAF